MLVVIQRLIALSLIGSALNHLPTFRPWFIELSLNFFTYFLILHIVSLVWLAFYRKLLHKIAFRILVIGTLAFSASYLRILAPFYLEQPKPATTGKSFTVLYANVEGQNKEYGKLKTLIVSHTPEIVALNELTAEWADALNLAQTYPYHIEIKREDNYGIGLYSQYPFEGSPLLTVGESGEKMQPLISTVIRFPEKAISLSVVHASPPLYYGAFYRNKLLLRRLSTVLRHQEMPQILVGDLNATPFSDSYRAFFEWNDFKDAAWGFGYSSTWNAKNPFFRLKIDHFLYNNNLGVETYRVLPEIGSDHYPLFVKFQY